MSAVDVLPESRPAPARSGEPSAHLDTFARDHLPHPDHWPLLTADLPELQYPERLNCSVELLDRTIERHGADRPCVYTESGEVWSYGDVQSRVARVAHVLVEDLGVRPGNRVLLRGPNSRWLLVSWLAALRVGAVVVTTMPMLRARELRVCLDKAAVDVALCDERYLDELTAAGLPAGRVVCWGERPGSELTSRSTGRSERFAAVPTAADDVALIAFTSGTSGTPKATAHFHRDVLAIADTFSAHLVRPRPDDVFAGSPPLAFTFGLGGLLVFPLRAGAATVLGEGSAPRDLFATVGRRRVTVLFTAPTAYRMVLDDLRDTNAFDLTSLRVCVSAGEALPAPVWHAFRRATGLSIVDGLGSTEMLHVFVAAAGGDIRPGTTGRVVPGYRARVVDDRGAEVTPGTVGMLEVQGPTGCRYLDDDRQLTTVRHGWTVTGDRYARDEDGYFTHHGRADDLIVSAGYNIAGPEIEQVLLAHPDVAECGVVGVPDALRGSIVKAFVVLRPGAVGDDSLTARLQAFVKSELAAYKYPRAVEFVEALPRTPNGKVQRAVLRSRHATPA